MNRDVCEHFNPVDLPCDKCKSASVQKSTLREAAQQALEAMEKATRFMPNKDYRKLNESIDVLKAALAEPVQGCPSCEYNKQRAQLWRNEAYKLGGHPLDWEPELMVRPKPLTEEEIERLLSEHEHNYEMIKFARAIERAHGIGGNT